MQEENQSSNGQQPPSLEEIQLLKADIVDSLEKNRKLFDEQKDTFRDLKTYKVVVQLVIFGLIGGGIAGVTYLGRYVDGRIADRLEMTESLMFANNHGTTESWVEALSSIDKASDFYLNDKAVIGPKVRSNYYVSAIWILANVPHDGIGLDWPGSNLWKRIKESRGFENEFSMKREWSNDWAAQFNLGDCWLKYSSSNEDLITAGDHYKKVIEVKPAVDALIIVKARLRLATVHLILNETKTASEVLSKVKALLPDLPKDHLLLKSADQLTEEVISEEFNDLLIIARRHGVKDYPSGFQKILTRL